MLPGDILKFWFEETPKKLHFNSTPAFDADIRQRFEELAIGTAAQAAKGEHDWETTPDGALALIIMLDQFPRNMYRGTAAAFAWDASSLNIAKRAIEKGFDLKTPIDRRAFIYTPFMHSENISDQRRCVELADQRLNDEGTLFHAKAHMKVIEQFGRFPYRNETLGRANSVDEEQYLNDGGYAP